MAAYFMATGHLAFGLGSLVGAEILKLTVVERLFQLNRNKLLSIRAFARGYGYWRRVMDWVETSEAWQTIRLYKSNMVQIVRGFIGKWTVGSKARRLSWQSRS